MTLIEDDAEINPAIASSQLDYIRCLPDNHKQYTRFFDALLVPRPSHAAFFRDLKGFRALPTAIHAFSLCDPDDPTISKEQRKENYRDVTRKYLGSRFAHPWCRKAMAGMGNTKMGGWWAAEWAATGKAPSKEQEEQEIKLHKVLIPIWVTFRGKMFPGTNVVDEWWERKQLESATAAKANNEPVKSTPSHAEGQTDASSASSYPELGFALKSSNPRNNTASSNDDEDDEDTTHREAATAATGLLRLAAAGMMLNSMSKMQKWKLKRELKRSSR